jgi:murein DD-endopeptidase MepM/ murein hydrolase activator NlpD
MKTNPHLKQIIALVLAILFTTMLACSVTSQPAVQTAVAQAKDTAVAAAAHAAETEAAHMIETAKVSGPTIAANLLQTAQVAGGTEAAQLFETAQVFAATAAYDALQTLMASASTPGSQNIPQFRLPVSGSGLTTSTGSDKQTGADEFAVDYFMPSEGAPVYPTLAGIIVYSGCDDPVYGCAVVILHQDPSWNGFYYSVYAHLQTSNLISEGSLVDGSSPIGAMGHTGTGGATAGIHLHFVVRTSDQLVTGRDALTGNSMNAFDFKPYMP